MTKRNFVREQNGRGVKKDVPETKRKKKDRPKDRKGSKGNERRALIQEYGK